MPDHEYDVVVVGGSLAGCAAARLLALRGARVAVVEKRPELDAYKVICTHNIQASAVPAMERLGIVPAIHDAGAVFAQIDIWTRYGWIRPPDRGRRNVNLRRSVLDPIVRRQAIETPGVDYLPGLTAVGLEGDEQVEGVRVSGHEDKERSLKARLVVAADGRGSQVARMAGVPARVRPHGRFCYFSYFRNVPLPDRRRALVWFGDPDMAYINPNEEGVSNVCVVPAKRRLGAFRGDPESAVRAHFRGLADAPNLDDARPLAKWFGKLEMPSTVRPAAARGMAFVGDAAQASDPIFGVGCGWAFQSADWLLTRKSARLCTDRIGSSTEPWEPMRGATAASSVPIIGSSPTTRVGDASRHSTSSSTRPRRATPSLPGGSRTSPPARLAASLAPGG
jgi:2-polyprenyl-6-methoxyphenol hydroxylase-like FAD-dependent oxidoreductase